MRLGRIAPTLAQKRRALPLKRYLRAPLPAAPLELDNTLGVTYGLFHNDKISNCTIAALAHFYATAAAREGWTVSLTEEDVTRYYFDLSGGQDTGLVEIDVLERAVAQGFPLAGTYKLHAWVHLDAQDLDALRASVSIFHAVYVGASLPLTAKAPGPWDADGLFTSAALPNSWGGHAMIIPKYDASGPTFVTWGRQQRASWAWSQLYVDEAYALLDAERAAIAGVDWPALQADLKAVEGS